ncbi:MAG: hypothetical protein U1F11_01125 [Steroidobacteraceae bacterium]
MDRTHPNPVRFTGGLAGRQRSAHRAAGGWLPPGTPYQGVDLDVWRTRAARGYSWNPLGAGRDRRSH